MNYIIFDLEATCQRDGFFDNEIIEIGAVKFNEKLENIGEFQLFIRPVVNPKLTDFCKELTTISQEDVDDKDTFDKSIQKFIDFCGDDFFLCSWGFYDKNQLEKDCKRYNLDTKWLDNHISIKHQHQNILRLKRGSGVWKALDNFGLKFEGTQHRGIDDARNISKVFIKIFEKLKF